METIRDIVISILITAGIACFVVLIVFLIAFPIEMRRKGECEQAKGVYVSAAVACFDSSAVIRLPPK